MGAPEAMLKAAVNEVPLTALTLPTETPLPLTRTFAGPEPAWKFDPVKVTLTVDPLRPLAGDMDVSVGVFGIGSVTVNCCAFVVPSAVVTVTLRAPGAAAASIVNFAVTEVSLFTFTSVAVTPVPLIVTFVSPVLQLEPPEKPFPVKVTVRVVPCTPLDGDNDVSVGGTGSPGESNRITFALWSTI
jgi:hypothetical protein